MGEEKVYERVMTASISWADKVCYLCGAHFRTGDQIVLVVPPFEYKREFKRLQHNVVVHLDEWLEFKRLNGNSMDPVLRALGDARKPKKAALSEEQQLYINQFISAAYDCGYRDSSKTRNGAKAKIFNSSDVLEYNVYTDSVTHRCRRKRQMFDSLGYHQAEVNVWNKMHELRGDGKRDNYKALDVICEAMERANSIIDK